jgi:hypothetical protein
MAKKIGSGSRKWGRWRLKRPYLVFWMDNREVYWVDLREAKTSAQVLDWIFQLATKSWMTPQDKSDLLDALRACVDPQRNLCSWGREVGNG